MLEISRLLQNMQQSQLCIGLDPNPADSVTERLQTILEIVDATHEYAIAYKPNRQFLLGFSLDEMQELTSTIHQYHKVAIIDHKLSDIGSSNRAALQWSAQEGYDFITVSPFPGNLKETAEYAQETDIGIIALTLMSNPEAKWMLNGFYQQSALGAEKYAQGIVIGTTDHITEDVLEQIAYLAPTPFVLAPGLGKQGGNPYALLQIFGNRVMFNVSRGISQAENYAEAAQAFYSQIEAAKH